MSLDNFIPAIWSERLLSNLHTALVYGQPGIVNRDYEGEIAGAGSSVKINSIGAVTVTDYTKNTDHAAPETLTDAQRTLLIDQQKMYNFQIDSVDAAQQKPKVMDEAMKEAAFALAKVTDSFIASLYTGFTAGVSAVVGDDTTPLTGFVAAPNKAYELLVDLQAALDTRDVPTEGRFAIVPPFFEAFMLKDQRFVSFGTAANRENLANGEIGAAAGFRIVKSNQVPNTAGAKYKIVAGHPMAWSFADQIAETVAYKPERRFGDALKGLHVYGAKVVRPTAGIVATVNNA
jgi:N4-gp56 family major capsid protein